MVRSAAALFAVLILSGFAALQQVATHTVVAGDTLWDLAERYYQNPFDWRRIWEANRAQVEDPNLIEPGLVLTIPGREASVAEVVVEGPAAPPAPPASSMRDDRTVFYQDTSVVRAGVVRSGDAEFLAVPQALVHAAPWLVPLDVVPTSLGVMDAFAGGANQTRTPRAWNRVHLVFSGAAPAVGTELLTFRTIRTVEGVGQVAVPTGRVTISEAEGSDAVAVVTREYELMKLGDLLAPIPEYPLRPGQVAAEVSGGGEAMVVGFAGTAELHDIGAFAFLDRGSDHGVSIGDEYAFVNTLAGRDQIEGRLQVVGVEATTSTARIVAISDAVFRQGVVVRLDRKMR